MKTALYPILSIVGFVLMLFALAFVVPLAYAMFNHEPTVNAFLAAFLFTISLGASLHLATRRYRRELQPRDGFLLVSVLWVGLPATAAVPLYLFFPALSALDAYFESVSALTTTGATVLTGLDAMPASINIWRHLLCWLGGMGILVLAVAILPLLGVGGSQVFKAETPGPLKDAKLTPRITQTARALYIVYVVISLMCAVSYRLAGMSWLDAFMHAGSTMSLAGFSAYDASFAHFNSPHIEAVAVIFMLIAMINFSMHFLAWRTQSLKVYWHCPETFWQMSLIVIAVALLTFFLVAEGQYSNILEAFRYVLFNVVSVASTTGFASTDYAQWPMFAPMLMLLLSIVASAAGSTGGGIKMLRAVILFKQAVRELSQTLHPRAVHLISINGSPVANTVIFGVLAFMLMYGLTVITLSMVLMFTGLDAVTAFSAILACINCLGPGLGDVGPASNFQGLTDAQTAICTMAMLLGRLELLPLLVLFTPAFWRK